MLSSQYNYCVISMYSSRCMRWKGKIGIRRPAVCFPFDLSPQPPLCSAAHFRKYAVAWITAGTALDIASIFILSYAKQHASSSISQANLSPAGLATSCFIDAPSKHVHGYEELCQTGSIYLSSITLIPFHILLASS